MDFKKNCIGFFVILSHIAIANTLDDSLSGLQQDLNFKNENLTAPVVSGACVEIGICNKVDNYPEELVRRLITQLKIRNNTDLKIERSDADDSICSEIVQFIPRAAKDINGNWQFILNPASGKPVQLFIGQICSMEGECTNTGFKFNTHDYKIYCYQKFLNKKMVYLNMETKMLHTKDFPVPICCSCYLE